ncbi:MAG: hypothetical protein KDA44_16530, partial [Planctomycetales bacterium]|nr:hypothetical protein [Planctomycetales bacterium]
VVYNWGGAATHRSELGPVRINLIGNYYICGPVKKSRRVFREDDPAVTKLFYDGNYLDADRDAEHDGTEIVGEEAVAEGYAGFTSEDELIGPQQGKPYRFIGTLADQRVSAPKAYERVVNSAGCSLHRDAIDAALIEQLQRREGQLIDSQEELRRPDGVLAGLDDLPTVHRPDDFDTDGDGMADEFERDHGLNPADPADGNGRELSRDGYTNLEFYLNWLLMPADKRVAFSAGQ